MEFGNHSKLMLTPKYNQIVRDICKRYTVFDPYFMHSNVKKEDTMFWAIPLTMLFIDATDFLLLINGADLDKISFLIYGPHLSKKHADVLCKELGKIIPNLSLKEDVNSAEYEEFVSEDNLIKKSLTACPKKDSDIISCLDKLKIKKYSILVYFLNINAMFYECENWLKHSNIIEESDTCELLIRRLTYEGFMKFLFKNKIAILYGGIPNDILRCIEKLNEDKQLDIIFSTQYSSRLNITQNVSFITRMSRKTGTIPYTELKSLCCTSDKSITLVRKCERQAYALYEDIPFDNCIDIFRFKTVSNAINNSQIGKQIYNFLKEMSSQEMPDYDRIIPHDIPNIPNNISTIVDTIIHIEEIDVHKDIVRLSVACRVNKNCVHFGYLSQPINATHSFKHLPFFTRDSYVTKLDILMREVHKRKATLNDYKSEPFYGYLVNHYSTICSYNCPKVSLDNMPTLEGTYTVSKK